MKGFVVSLDSLMALMVAFSLISTSLYILAGVKAKALASAAMRGECLDLLASLEKSGKLALLASSGGQAEVKRVFSATQESVCLRLRVRNANGTLVREATKPGCGSPSGSVQAAARSFVEGGEFYMAELASWRE